MLSSVLADDCGLSSAKLAAAKKNAVTQVIDGDTIRIAGGKLVRFIGINTPEIDHQHGQSQPFAEKARERLKAIINSHDNIVVLKIGYEPFDRHGRQLAHIFTPDGENIQADLLREGLGVWITVPPNLRFMDCYRTSEIQAHDNGAGVWGEQFREPRDSKSLRNKDVGFQWIQGKIIRIGKGKSNWWLNFEDSAEQQQRHQKYSRVTLRVHKDDLHYFKEQLLEDLLNKVVRVKGWISHYKKQLVMSLKHPASIEIVSQQ